MIGSATAPPNPREWAEDRFATAEQKLIAQYNIACCYAAMGDKLRAMELLRAYVSKVGEKGLCRKRVQLLAISGRWPIIPEASRCLTPPGRPDLRGCAIRVSNVELWVSGCPGCPRSCPVIVRIIIFENRERVASRAVLASQRQRSQVRASSSRTYELLNTPDA